VTTQTANEAADRLLAAITEFSRTGRWDERGENRSSDMLREALAAERRAMVERIRAEFEGRTWHPDDKERIDRILDEEAAR
jgi:hypothetical protein